MMGLNFCSPIFVISVSLSFLLLFDASAQVQQSLSRSKRQSSYGAKPYHTTDLRTSDRVNSPTRTSQTRIHSTITSSSSSSTSSSRGRDRFQPTSSASDPFGPIKVTDVEVDTNSSANSGFIYRKVENNPSTPTATPSQSRGSPYNTRFPSGSQQPHSVWHDRSWHWSTNRSRGYDPDLDGTTTPAPVQEWRFPSPPPLIEPYIDTKYPFDLTSCDEQSCHPATGNLLIGREDKLTASSTCGLKSQERYCMLTSSNSQQKKCFICDYNDKGNNFAYHGVENIVPARLNVRKDRWWQAENGVQEAYIQFDLESEFHFTHLYISFKTFRPAAMSIERSKDHGKTWEVYQYFASNCTEMYRGISDRPRRRLNEVVCTTQYSSLDIASYGEVIFRVIPPAIVVDNPYAEEVQNLLKLTNLRLNFSRLHTLGDERLDHRPEIKEKYFYSIQKMIVRGKCSCYGHANRCVPARGQEITQDMVYGTCECQHNTVGKNCELCHDLYNDRKWQPAYGDRKNECIRCECNNHATKCHYDPSIFSASGNVSGGVCENCLHNTFGSKCELCLENFYRDPSKSLDDPEVCKECDCDPNGSVDDAICDAYTDQMANMISGRCHCKENVEGVRCDQCKAGFWNFTIENPVGCQPCSCHKEGTVGNQGCDTTYGTCICKRNVVGRDCNECAVGFYGLGSEDDGCKACDCDPGGSYDNLCEEISGQCKCRPHVDGRKCDSPAPLYFSPHLDHIILEAETRGRLSPDIDVAEREPFPDTPSSWSGPGFVRTSGKGTIEFDISDLPESKPYDILVRYETQGSTSSPPTARIVVERMGPPDYTGPCANQLENDDEKLATFHSNGRIATAGPGSVCLERGKSYRIRVAIHGEDDSKVLIDSLILEPTVAEVDFMKKYPEKAQEFEQYRCEMYVNHLPHRDIPEPCKKLLSSVGYTIFDGALECRCDGTGSLSANCDPLGGQCKCKSNVIGRTCNKCAPGFYDFGPDGCKPCDCHGIGSLDNFCAQNGGQCKCRNNTYGRQCDECQPGFWNYPNCQRCDCNGHSDICESKTGVCINCRDYTDGPACEACSRGFYGNPMLGIDIPCRPCPCPGVPGSGVSHADTCYLDPRTSSPICKCLPGYTGERCDKCDHNYFGNPVSPGGLCISCNCSGNIDLNDIYNCDPKSGQCLKCLHNTEGDHCEICRKGTHGDAFKQTCIDCVCNEVGTDGGRDTPCDQHTGQCNCLPHVVGKDCDECAPNHFNITSGTGCEPCDCDRMGSSSLKCNVFDGQCYCEAGRGGRKCNECQANHWGNPRENCSRCECNPEGSVNMQCDRKNGACECKRGISGPKCDQCARGFLGRAPVCEACGECFDNWDIVIQDLRTRTDVLVERARRIKQTGVKGAFKDEFQQIETHLTSIERILKEGEVSNEDVAAIEALISSLKTMLNKLQDELGVLENEVNEMKNRVTNGNIELGGLKKSAEALGHQIDRMNSEMTELQEGNVDGAFNLIQENANKSAKARDRVNSLTETLKTSASFRASTERTLTEQATYYNQSLQTNNISLDEFSKKISTLEKEIPKINQLVCDGRAAVGECDQQCGGAGCISPLTLGEPRCGGLSCKGAVNKADDALLNAKNIKESLSQKQEKARNELESVQSAAGKADEALKTAEAAFEKCSMAKNISAETTSRLNDLKGRIDNFFTPRGSKPSEIRTMGEECMALKMSLTPDEILELSREINATRAGITNIDSILVNTAGDVNLAEALKKRADIGKEKADNILKTANEVQEALSLAKQAQDKAKNAIETANNMITRAGADLNDTKRESTQAEQMSSQATSEIEDLSKRLTNLKQKYVTNEISAKRASQGADAAKKLSTETKEKATDLETKYQNAKVALENKSRHSGENKSRAETLRERAASLANNSTTKFKLLQGLDSEFEENERKLGAYKDQFDNLNKEMIDYLDTIQKRAEFHRVCRS